MDVAHEWTTNQTEPHKEASSKDQHAAPRIAREARDGASYERTGAFKEQASLHGLLCLEPALDWKDDEQ